MNSGNIAMPRIDRMAETRRPVSVTGKMVHPKVVICEAQKNRALPKERTSGFMRYSQRKNIRVPK